MSFLSFISPPGRVRRCGIEIFTLLLLTFLFLYGDGFFAVDRFTSIGFNKLGQLGWGEYVRRTVFVMEYVLALVCLWCMSALKWRVAWLPVLVFAVFFCIDSTLHIVYGRPADISNIAMLNDSLNNVGDALRQFQTPILQALGYTSVLVGVMIVKSMVFPWSHQRLAGSGVLLSLVLILGMYGAVLMQRGAPALIGFPKGFSYLNGSVFLKANQWLSPVQALVEPVPWEGGPVFKRIVVVVDESIEYSHLAQHGDFSEWGFENYGPAYSGANCSAASNYILRKAFWDRNAVDPFAARLPIQRTRSVFELAKRAGYHTVFMDNQNVLKDRTVRNYMDDAELAWIDEKISNEQALYRRDQDSVAQIKVLLRGERVLVYVNKNGAHFPYQQTVPASEVTGQAVQDYQRSVQHNTVEFLHALAQDLPPSSIILYTSDHGQNLHAAGTHCNSGQDIDASEYRVPFLIKATPSKPVQFWAMRGSAGFSWSHLEFSETLRNLLGVQIPGVASLLKRPAAVSSAEKPFIPYCGLYGQPTVFFGAWPECRVLASVESQR